MNFQPTIPAEYALHKVDLNWPDALWGFRHGKIRWKSFKAIAQHLVTKGESNEVIASVANSNKDTFSSIWEGISETILDENDCAKNKWLYLTLSWLYVNQLKVEDPLNEIEMIYAEFDYPEEMESFVRYMPATDGYDPQNHSLAENRKRLMLKWKDFLDQHALHANCKA